MSSQGNDPRLPSAAKPYKPQPVASQDLPMDYSGFIAVVFGVFGAMFRYKTCSWLAIIFSAQSLANMKNIETDLRQISMAMIDLGLLFSGDLLSDASSFSFIFGAAEHCLCSSKDEGFCELEKDGLKQNSGLVYLEGFVLGSF
nr:protein Asterix [Ipomoea batatas]